MKYETMFIIRKINYHRSMGCLSQTPVQPLHPLPEALPSKYKVFSLNFCGILKSPFEFYSGEYHSLSRSLGEVFQSLLPQYLEGKSVGQFQKAIGSLDKKSKDYRYSPLYRIDVGIENKKFITKDRFIELWHAQFAEKSPMKHSSFTSQQKKAVLRFDLLVYHTLLRHLYNISNLDQAVSLDPKLYINTYSPLFNQSFLDFQLKISQLVSAIDTHDFDILFLQEANTDLIRILKQKSKFYVSVSEDEDTMILANAKTFKKIRDIKEIKEKLAEQEWKKVDWNGHTSVMLVDQYILISGHLASKKAPNESNIKDLKQILPLFKRKFPSYEIICGADCNSFLPSFSKQFEVFPAKDDVFTTLKKRTRLQAQFEKAQKTIKETKDHIITTLHISEGAILLLNGKKPTEESFLPIDQHPYDHFIADRISDMTSILNQFTQRPINEDSQKIYNPCF